MSHQSLNDNNSQSIPAQQNVTLTWQVVSMWFELGGAVSDLCQLRHIGVASRIYLIVILR